MKKTNVTLNGVDFDFYSKTVHADVAYADCKYADIWEAYNKPSHIKELIYCNWRNYFHELDKNAIVQVRSRNCNFFTIKATFTYDNVEYVAIISPTHNDLYEIAH